MKRKIKVKHTVNGDQREGWYCYICRFWSRNVEEAAAHDGTTETMEVEVKDSL